MSQYICRDINIQTKCQIHHLNVDIYASRNVCQRYWLMDVYDTSKLPKFYGNDNQTRFILLQLAVVSNVCVKSIWAHSGGSGSKNEEKLMTHKCKKIVMWGRDGSKCREKNIRRHKMNVPSQYLISRDLDFRDLKPGLLK